MTMELRRTTTSRSAFPNEDECEHWEPAAGFISARWYELLESKLTLIWYLHIKVKSLMNWDNFSANSVLQSHPEKLVQTQNLN